MIVSRKKIETCKLSPRRDLAVVLLSSHVWKLESRGKGSGVCSKKIWGRRHTTDDHQPRRCGEGVFNVGTDISTWMERHHQHGTQGLKIFLKIQSKNNISQTCTIFAFGFVVDTSSTNPAHLCVLNRATTQQPYRPYTGWQHVTTAVALAVIAAAAAFYNFHATFCLTELFYPCLQKRINNMEFLFLLLLTFFPPEFWGKSVRIMGEYCFVKWKLFLDFKRKFTPNYDL